MLPKSNYWEEPEAILPLDEVTTPAYLLSVQVDVVFRNDPHGKLYRTLCLKTVSNEIGGPGVTSGDAIRQLFGGAVSGQERPAKRCCGGWVHPILGWVETLGSHPWVICHWVDERQVRS